MAGIELPLAIFGTFDLAINYGQKLVKLCAAFRGAEDELTERILRVEIGWLKTAKQLEFIQRVEGLMDQHHRDISERTVEMLQAKLKVVLTKIGRAIKLPDGASDGLLCRVTKSNVKPIPKRWKYALLKESLDEAIDQLETWQSIADPSWYLILRNSNSQIDIALARDDMKTVTLFPTTKIIRASLQDFAIDKASGIFLPPAELEKMALTEIPFCEAKMATRSSGRNGLQSFLLTQMQCPPEAKILLVRRDLRDLARKLPKNDPQKFHLLSCKGIVEKVDCSTLNMPARVTFTMVFRTPAHLSDPKSLRDMLLSGAEEMALSDKFDMAQQMAKSISYVHTFGFVHKNVRPETLITFINPKTSTLSSLSSLSSRVVFLIGFSTFRREEGKTYRLGDDDWEKNLYRHPSRQGLNPSDNYKMQHDIYSLGVCLLELGLGRSFVNYDARGGRVRPSSLVASDDGENGLSGDARLLEPDSLKIRLVGLARGELRRCMGGRYSRVVETCLTCLDRDNTDFGDENEFLDQDGVLVGVRYIEKVLFQLNAICV